MTKIRNKHPIKTLIVDKNAIQVPQAEPQSINNKKGAIHPPKYRVFIEQKKKKDPHQEAPKGNIQENSRGDTSGTHTYSLIKQK